jgi:hypothetical protein
MRFTDFLRVSVLIYAGAATVLAVITVAGITRSIDDSLIFVAAGWWVAAAIVGLWLGRRNAPTPGIGRLLGAARASHTLPEVEPGAILFNRLWPVAVFAVASGAIGFFIPQVPAVASGFPILVALTWRKQAAAVQAIEDRDGVRFYFDRSSPFGPPQLVRTPWARKIEPTPATAPVS